MAGKSGVCRTVGYVDPITGSQIIFAKQEKPTAGKRKVAFSIKMKRELVQKWLDGEWNDLEDYFYPDFAEKMECLKFDEYGQMYIGGRKLA